MTAVHCSESRRRWEARGPAREARALQRSLDHLLTRGMERRILAAGDRIEALGVSNADTQAFRQLAD